MTDVKDPRSAAVQVFEQLAGIPSVTSATFENGQLKLRLKQRDFSLEEDLTSQVSIPIADDDRGRASLRIDQLSRTTPINVKGYPIVAEKSCPSTGLKIALREAPDARQKDGKKRTVELWQQGRRLCSDDVSDVHGKFITDDTFGSLDILGEHGIAVYSAEAKSASASSDGPEEAKRSKSEKFAYAPSLGEKSGTNLRPAVFIFTWSAEAVKERKQQPWVDINGKCIGSLTDGLGAEFQSPAVLFGQATLAGSTQNGGQTVCYATGYKSLPNEQRLGIIYCTNRPSAIYRFRLAVEEAQPRKLRYEEPTKDCTPLPFAQDPSLTWRRPRTVSLVKSEGLSPIFLIAAFGTPQGGAHNNESYVRFIVQEDKVDGATSEDFLFEDKDANSKAAGRPVAVFPGRDLSFPWLSNGTSDKPASQVDFLINSVQNDSPCIHKLTLDFSKRTLVSKHDWDAGVEAIGSDGHSLLALQKSAPNSPPVVLLHRFPATSSPAEGARMQFDRKASGFDLAEYAGLHWLKQQLSTQLSWKSSFTKASHASVVILENKSNRQAGRAQPTILMPHGGPHGVTTDTFIASHAALALFGYQVAMPNYSGSIGQNRKFVEHLIGRCGELDVKDCMDALDVAQDGKPAPAYIMGGSHGGFLAAHLVSQHPNRFLAAAMRNPVIDIASMVATTDIPDWSYSELGLPFDFARPPLCLSAEHFQAMRDASPIKHIEKLKARVLLLVGLSDRRVPPQQGMLYYHALKNLGKDIEMYTFADADHALDTIDAQWSAFERSFVHFEKTAKEHRQQWSVLKELEGVDV